MFSNDNVFHISKIGLRITMVVSILRGSRVRASLCLGQVTTQLLFVEVLALSQAHMTACILIVDCKDLRTISLVL